MTPPVEVVPAIPRAVDRIGEFAAEVRRDLALAPKQLQSKYLYDSLGSSLFEAICRLPWYPITRAERRLLTRHASLIAAALPGPTTMIELGCGTGEKLAVLAEAFGSRGRAFEVHLIDISPVALEQSEQRLERFHISTVGHRSTYEVGLRHAAACRPAGRSLLVLFLGSNIGNFDSPAAADFLDQIRAALQPGDALVLGADLVKPERDLLLAYADPLGVTAAFNKNLLARINRELRGTFDLDAFDHRAVWNEIHSRIEMRLVSRRVQSVSIPDADCVVEFEREEWIWTESSYKYTPDEIVGMGRRAGFDSMHQWIDEDARFALTLFAAT
jgi:dimethylhistidine N-methyltransferase